jgi:hypothetical protein
MLFLPVFGKAKNRSVGGQALKNSSKVVKLIFQMLWQIGTHTLVLGSTITNTLKELFEGFARTPRRL